MPASRDLIPAWQDGCLAPVAKLEVHRRGLRHRAVSVFVLRGDEVLLQRRALCKYHTPGLWANACCTHPLWDEDVEDCAVRRLSEEMGLTGLDLQRRGEVEYRADVGGGMIEHEVVAMFRAEAPEAVEPVPDPREVMETRWLHRASLEREVASAPDRFAPWLRIYLARHSQAIFD